MFLTFAKEAIIEGGVDFMDMTLIKFIGVYQDIISLENLLVAWKEFIKGKKSRKDVQEFQRNLMLNVISLHEELKRKTYRHASYEAFKIFDPKPRDIHKASVKDRLLHHAIYQKLYPYFDKRFINDSYSCRLNKGTHKAIQRFKKYTDKVSKNNTRTAWILKCDVRKFFASIDQMILIKVLSKYIQDTEVIQLLRVIIQSFYSTESEKGLPLGNLTSQLLVNVYMNEFDQYMKHVLKVKHYIRYADDFVIIHNERLYLADVLKKIDAFLHQKLKLKLHPNKVFIETLASGVDFLGWVHFPNHRVCRTTTKRRMFINTKADPRPQVIDSYLGMLRHGNAKGLQAQIEALKIVDNSA